jgi:hypothetical protein
MDEIVEGCESLVQLRLPPRGRDGKNDPGLHGEVGVRGLFLGNILRQCLGCCSKVDHYSVSVNYFPFRKYFSLAETHD